MAMKRAALFAGCNELATPSISNHDNRHGKKVVISEPLSENPINESVMTMFITQKGAGASD